MMNTQSIDQLIKLLETLENVSNQLNDALKQEKEILRTPDSQELLALTFTKKKLVSDLENLTKTTHLFLKKHNVEKGLYQLSNFISDVMPADSQLLLNNSWSTIQKLSIDNKKLNELNGSIIELNRRYTQRSLDILRGQIGTNSATYGSKGQVMSSRLSRSVNTA
ncbi:MAG: flagellar protein FlgN [Cycloclasticus sp.]|nr:flagellar protein FlgN [Cycloclasticus sp.]